MKDKRTEVLHIRLTEDELLALNRLVSSLGNPPPERSNVVRAAINDYIAANKKDRKKSK